MAAVKQAAFKLQISSSPDAPVLAAAYVGFASEINAHAKSLLMEVLRAYVRKLEFRCLAKREA